MASLGAGFFGGAASVLGQPLLLYPWEQIALPSPVAKRICERLPAYTYHRNEGAVFKHKLRVVV